MEQNRRVKAFQTRTYFLRMAAAKKDLKECLLYSIPVFLFFKVCRISILPTIRNCNVRFLTEQN